MEVAQKWELIGGHFVLDFVNTVDDRLDSRPTELLNHPSDLASWGVAAGLLPATPRLGAGAHEELTGTAALRGHLISLLDAAVDLRAPARGDLQALSREAADAYNVAALAYEGGRLCWRWDGTELSTIRHRIATSTVDLLASQSAERIGRCPGPGCGWFFLDTTKRGNRRWCSMSDCGQESKSARRRSRRETPTAG
ncbi:MAG: CGNR zinc finger domain-containing protein [Acidimicrobiales bacterium]